MNIEKKAADAVLENDIEIKIGDSAMKMPQPTLATLVMVSKYTPDLPNLMGNSNTTVIDAILSNSDKLPTIAHIAAIFILGARRIKEGYKVPVERKEMANKKVLWIFNRKKEVTSIEYIPELDYIKNLIIEIMTPKELAMLLLECMSFVDVKDFFGVTVSLSGANLLKSTEAVEIASGD